MSRESRFTSSDFQVPSLERQTGSASRLPVARRFMSRKNRILRKTFRLLTRALMWLALGFAGNNIPDLSFRIPLPYGLEITGQLHGQAHPPPSAPKKLQHNKQTRRRTSTVRGRHPNQKHSHLTSSPS